MMERRASQEVPIDLIESGQFLSAEEIFSERRTDDPLEMVVRSEVEMYFGRLDQAGLLLDQVALRATEIEVAARFSLASGRLATRRHDYPLASTHLQTAYYFYNFQRDSFRTSHALLELGRLARLTGNLDDAELKLAAAQEGVKGRTSKRSEFMRGTILSEQAALSVDKGDTEAAVEHYTNAMRLLKATERGRNYGLCLIGMAGLKCAMGEYQESLDLYKESNIVFERYDLRQELAEAQLDLAKALIRLQKYERAEKLADDSRDMMRGIPAGESQALCVLSLVEMRRNAVDQAVVHALAALDLADQSGVAEVQARARIALGVARLAERDFKVASDLLKEAADLAAGRGPISDTAARRHSVVSTLSKQLELEAIIYLGEAYHNTDTRAGRTELARAGEILGTLGDAWLLEEYNRVSAKYEEQIVFTDDNRLVFDGNQLPKWQEAKRTLEGFLLRNALRQTSNSLTRAARKLGVSKVHVHNLKKKHGL
jgi:tetratricopeptide (TPR) repeat protein